MNDDHRDELGRAAAARLPAAGLAALADLRREPGILAAVEGDSAWLLWTSPNPELARRLLGLPGATLFVERMGCWHRLGRRLPDPDARPGAIEARPLSSVLLPERLEPEPPPTGRPAPARLELVREGQGIAREATAWLGPAGALARWAASPLTPSARLAGLRAAAAGAEVLVVGPRPPAIAEGVRLWGDRVLVPLGFRPEPALLEPALRSELGVPGHDLLLLTGAGAEVVPRAAFRGLSRASARLAAGEVGT